MRPLRPHCEGSWSWPDGTRYPAGPNDIGFAICGACGKRVATNRSPSTRIGDKEYAKGVLRAHRLAAPK